MAFVILPSIHEHAANTGTCPHERERERVCVCVCTDVREYAQKTNGRMTKTKNVKADNFTSTCLIVVAERLAIQHSAVASSQSYDQYSNISLV